MYYAAVILNTYPLSTLGMRVDKWIWAVRMVKSRTLAGQLCQRGKVMVNGLKAKPATNLKLGDLVEVQNKQVIKCYQVDGFIPKRVSAALAAENFIDISPKPDQTSQTQAGADRWGRREKGEGRPTKKDWRDLQETKWFDA